MQVNVSVKKRTRQKSREFFEIVKCKEHTRIVALIHDALLPNCGVYTEDLSNASISDLLSFEFDYSLVSCEEARNIRQLLALYSKDASLSIDGIDKEYNAWKDFQDAELICHTTNKRLRDLFRIPSWWEIHTKAKTPRADMPDPVHTFILRCAEIVNVIVGECPDYSDIPFKFGPGSSSTVSLRTTAPFKLEAVPVCSREAVKSGAVIKLFATLPSYACVHPISSVRIGPGILRFVPKNALKHRTMIIEPIINTAEQIGIGTVLKQRFKQSCGIDLSNQWQINMNLARMSSDPMSHLCGKLATVDFSMASDLLCYILIMLCFPLSWFNLLSDWRTGTVSYSGNIKQFIHISKLRKKYAHKGMVWLDEHCRLPEPTWVNAIELEKFSTMGNGFTFELESIVFYAMALAVIGGKAGINNPRDIINHCRDTVSIFGDDLIVPTHAIPGIKWAASALGCKINHKKSFWIGPFRESCGGDYLRGINIRPFYIKDTFTSARIVGFLNHDARSDVKVISSELREQLIRFIPERDILYGPDNYGDGHIVVSNYDAYDYLPSTRKVDLVSNSGFFARFTLRDGHELTYFSSLKKRSYSDPIENSIGDVLLPMYESQFFSDSISERKEHDPYVLASDEKTTRVRIRVGEPFGVYPPIYPEAIPCTLPLFTPLLGNTLVWLHLRKQTSRLVTTSGDVKAVFLALYGSAI